MSKMILIGEAKLTSVLEALEWNMDYLPSHGHGTSMASKAITALREALAEQPVSVQQGWETVPVEPTVAMIDATGAVEADMREMVVANWKEMLAAAPQPAQQEPVQQGILARKWVLHGSFADVASFDSDGVPSFYGKESVAKFQKGQLSEPCKGKNCGSLNGWLHSAECRAEHEEHYTSPPAQRKPLTDEQREKLRDAFAQALTSVYVCGRVWDAWQYSTMSEDDFKPASECNELLDGLIEAAHDIKGDA